MTTQTRKVARRPLTADHAVQFFDAADTLGGAAAGFLHDGLVAGADALVVAKPSSIRDIGRALAERGVSLAALIAAGRLMIVDAAATLQAFMQGADPDPARFAAVVGTLVGERRKASNGPLRIYGEMVDILAAEGNFRGAARVEELWTALLAAQPSLLMCGYLAPHFATPNGAEALRAICDCHGQVRHDPADLLASWLLMKADVLDIT